MFQDLNIDSDMLCANENYCVSTYITDFNSFEMISASDVNVQMNNSVIAGVVLLRMVPLCNRNHSVREIQQTILCCNVYTHMYCVLSCF